MRIIVIISIFEMSLCDRNDFLHFLLWNICARFLPDGNKQFWRCMFKPMWDREFWFWNNIYCPSPAYETIVKLCINSRENESIERPQCDAYTRLHRKYTTLRQEKHGHKEFYIKLHMQAYRRVYKSFKCFRSLSILWFTSSKKKKKRKQIQK